MAREEAPDAFATSHWVQARDPRDLSRLLWYLLVVIIGIVAARGGEQTTAGFEGDLIQLVSHLPEVVVGLIVIAMLVLSVLLGLGIPIGLMVTRRWRLFGIVILGNVLATTLTLLADAALKIGKRSTLPTFALDPGQAGGQWPPSQSVAVAVSVLVLLTPYLSTAWRRFGWAYVLLLALVRILLSDDVVLDVVLAIGIGGTVASVLLLGFGRRVSQPTPIAVQGALDRIGLFPEEVRLSPVEAAGSMAFVATLPDGARLHCKVLSAGQYEADSLMRAYRRVRTQGLGEEVPYSTVRRAAAVEAMLASAARRGGARTPEVVGVAPLPSGNEMVVAFDFIDATPLDRVPAERITDEVLDQAWQAVAAMRSVGVAHRDLQLSSWMLDEADRLWLIDFSFGEPAASDGALSTDIAELLAASYAVVGTERAVAAAVRVLGAPALSSGLSYLVPAALTRATRGALKGTEGLAPLVHAAAEACGVAEPELAAIERVKPRTLAMAGLLAVAVYVLLPQLADLPRMIEAIKEADPRYAAGALLASVVTYIGSGLAMSGSAAQRIRLVHSMLAAVAATFVGAFAPPGVAHVGLNTRFYQKQGMPPAVAISATAAKEVGVGAVHIILLVVMAVVAGSSGALQDELDKLPSLGTVGIVVAIVLAVVGIAAATPRVRDLVRRSVIPAVKESLGSLRELAENPARMLTLFVGALLLQLGYVAALYLAVRALGGEAGFVTIGLIYLTVGSAASVAPTPGGVGAVEAVLLAALTGVGMAAAPALAAVFLYRLVTFWIPIPVGGLSFRALLDRDLL